MGMYYYRNAKLSCNKYYENDDVPIKNWSAHLILDISSIYNYDIIISSQMIINIKNKK